jgi:hypothetical protein
VNNVKFKLTLPIPEVGPGLENCKLFFPAFYPLEMSLVCTGIIHCNKDFLINIIEKG